MPMRGEEHVGNFIHRQWGRADEVEKLQLIDTYAEGYSTVFFSSKELLKTLSPKEWAALISVSSPLPSSVFRKFEICYDYTENTSIFEDVLLTFNEKDRQLILRKLMNSESFYDKIPQWAFDFAMYNYSKKPDDYTNLLEYILDEFTTMSGDSLLGHMFRKWLKTAPYNAPLIEEFGENKLLIDWLAKQNIESPTLFKITKRIEFAPQAIKKMFLHKEEKK